MKFQRTRYFISLIFILFFTSCDNIKEREKSIEEQMIGKWKLSYCIAPSDSFFIGSSWIQFSQGNLFNSNTSFFWTKDSSRIKPLSGKYSTVIYDYTLPVKGMVPYTNIVLQVDTISKSWCLAGLNDTTMYWSIGVQYPTQYLWTKIK